MKQKHRARRVTRRPTIRSRKSRRGTATVELAVCLPALALLLFGSMQACDMIYLKHSLTTAAYEGSLEAARPDATSATVQARVEQVMQIRGVKNGSVSINAAADIKDLGVGDSVRLNVSAPVKQNLMISGFFGTPNQLSVRFDCTH